MPPARLPQARARFPRSKPPAPDLGEQSLPQECPTRTHGRLHGGGGTCHWPGRLKGIGRDWAARGGRGRGHGESRGPKSRCLELRRWVRAALPNWQHRGEAGGVLGGGRVMAQKGPSGGPWMRQETWASHGRSRKCLEPPAGLTAHPRPAGAGAGQGGGSAVSLPGADTHGTGSVHLVSMRQQSARQKGPQASCGPSGWPARPELPPPPSRDQWQLLAGDPRAGSGHKPGSCWARDTQCCPHPQRSG